MYEYRGKVTRVVDGDTIDVKIDLGFGITYDIRLRLKGIDTPEIYGPSSKEEYEEGMKAKNLVEKYILDRWVLIKTYKDRKGKYGRYIGDVFFDGMSLVDILKKYGYNTVK